MCELSDLGFSDQAIKGGRLIGEREIPGLVDFYKEGVANGTELALAELLIQLLPTSKYFNSFNTEERATIRSFLRETAEIVGIHVKTNDKPTRPKLRLVY